MGDNNWYLFLLIVFLVFAGDGGLNYTEIAVMGASGAVGILNGSQMKKMEDAEERAKFRAEKEAEYTKEFANPYQAASLGYIDDVIEPRNTRFRICRALEALANKKDLNPAKKHGNIPL